MSKLVATAKFLLFTIKVFPSLACIPMLLWQQCFIVWHNEFMLTIVVTERSCIPIASYHCSEHIFLRYYCHFPSFRAVSPYMWQDATRVVADFNPFVFALQQLPTRQDRLLTWCQRKVLGVPTLELWWHHLEWNGDVMMALQPHSPKSGKHLLAWVLVTESAFSPYQESKQIPDDCSCIVTILIKKQHVFWFLSDGCCTVYVPHRLIWKGPFHYSQQTPYSWVGTHLWYSTGNQWQYQSYHQTKHSIFRSTD